MINVITIKKKNSIKYGKKSLMLYLYTLKQALLSLLLIFKSAIHMTHHRAIGCIEHSVIKLTLIFNRRTQEKKRNRAKNAGGVPAEGYKVVLALINALKELKPRSSNKRPNQPTELSAEYLYFIYLWITGSINSLSSPADIPDLIVVTGADSCQPHRLRRMYRSNKRWIEYAMTFQTRNGELSQWQPLPSAIVHLFIAWIDKHNTLTLSKIEKENLFNALKVKKWRAPSPINNIVRLKKDLFFDYMIKQTRMDPYLSTPVKDILLNGRLHHRYAIYYQSLNSNQIRYDLFQAHEAYLNRLVPYINDTKCADYRDFSMADHKRLPILAVGVEFPTHLSKKGEILAYNRMNFDSTWQMEAIPALQHGSIRALSQENLTSFFNFIRQDIERYRPKKAQSIDELREYYNARTFELGLLFVLLTGARPNHHITFNIHSCFEIKSALIKDKGRERLIYLCDYLASAINDYLLVQHQLLKKMSIDKTQLKTRHLMWYLINDDNDGIPLTAKTLREYMNDAWQRCFPNTKAKVVPYQLRHSFAQHALLASAPRLPTQQIDYLMGHFEQGEGIEDYYATPKIQHKLMEHLNRWPERLNLPSCYSPKKSKNHAR
ncbi:site-specific integrase [Vibrio sp. SS-MA-C1-2]|uniref:site-specific integrase n=1 Tax=Vibrio sp. SS-MA-C1-2 TaxID=2908646 RepID=UPI001F2C6463|nr:site-specific integrase [Vibrio sp. SS-MA-C1-2]UJF18523.1 site-specific integrase [Vibrio sp. SS-MA-C1-2]